MTISHLKSSNIEKKYWTFIVLLVFFSVFLWFLRPASAEAEAIYKVLSNANVPGSVGSTIHAIWKGLLDVVNSLIIIVIIMVAFSEMLRLNINTYGVKKALPTLLLAIVAANFSFLFCQILIDVSNVSITFLNSIAGHAASAKLTSDLAGTNPPWNASVEWYKNFFPSFLNNIFLLAEAIILLCLAFLFLVRNAVLYILVSLSAIAFMGIVLPQTKKYFNMWWDNMIKWTFMPLVSYFFIIAGNKFGPLISGKTGTYATVTGAVVIGACYYYAITMPFKLGGAIMDNFYKYTGAQWAKNQTTRMAKDELNNFWDQRKAAGLQNKYTSWMFGGVGKNREYRLAQTAADLKAAQDDSVSRYVGRNAVGIARRQEHRKTLEGSTAYAEAMGRKEISTAGTKYYDETRARRAKSNKYIIEMDGAEKVYQNLNDKEKAKILDIGAPDRSEEYFEKLQAVGYTRKEAEQTRAMIQEYGEIVATSAIQAENVTKATNNLLKYSTSQAKFFDDLQVKEEKMTTRVALLDTLLDPTQAQGHAAARAALLHTHGIETNGMSQAEIQNIRAAEEARRRVAEQEREHATGEYIGRREAEIPMYLRSQFTIENGRATAFTGLRNNIVERGRVSMMADKYVMDDARDYTDKFAASQLSGALETGFLEGEYTLTPQMMRSILAGNTVSHPNVRKVLGTIRSLAGQINTGRIVSDASSQSNVRNLLSSIGSAQNMQVMRRIASQINRESGGSIISNAQLHAMLTTQSASQIANHITGLFDQGDHEIMRHVATSVRDSAIAGYKSFA